MEMELRLPRVFIPQAIKDRRLYLGLTIAELSKAVGIHPSELYRIEKGQRFPSARTLKKLAKPLGFSEVELFKIAGYLSQDAKPVYHSPLKTSHLDRLLRKLGVR